MVFNGYASTVSATSENDKNVVYSISLKDIMKKTKLKFDCLVADCEGCLCDFFKENEKYLKDYKMIIFESDYPENCDYDEIKKSLKLWGFSVIIDRFVSVWAKE